MMNRQMKIRTGIAAAAAVAVMGGTGFGIAGAMAADHPTPAAGTHEVDRPEAGDTPDAPGAVDKPEAGDTPDAPGQN